jgi:Ni,Fe-hydrogenase III small subunit/ferredoxin-like protein FixX
MFDILRERLKQKHRTIRWPNGSAPELPEHFIGAPTIHPNCPNDCSACIDVCPVQALETPSTPSESIKLDLGKCIFCRACETACPEHKIHFTKEFQTAALSRTNLFLSSKQTLPQNILHEKAHALFGRSLKLRQVSAGGCNACEADINVLGTIGWDMGRFGIQLVASPRHADGLIVTGPVTQNMKEALLQTYHAIPDPKIVIAVGACACSGGLFSDHPETCGGLDTLLPVDLYIPGCPPHPLTILDALLRFIGQADTE